MIKKIFLGAGTVLSALLPIVSVVSCGDMNDYSETKHNKFWSGDEEDSKKYAENSNRFSGKRYSKVMPLNELLSDMGKLKIYDETGEKWTDAKIKEEIKKTANIDFENDEQVKKTLAYSEMGELDTVYYYWKDESEFESGDFQALETELKKKATEAWDANNSDNKYSEATKISDMGFIKYGGVLFWFRRGQDNLKNKIFGAKDQDSLDNLDQLIDNIKSEEDKSTENQELISKIKN